MTFVSFPLIKRALVSGSVTHLNFRLRALAAQCLRPHFSRGLGAIRRYLAIAAFCSFSSVCPAVLYVVSGENSQAHHREDYLITYDPVAGWSQESVWGHSSVGYYGLEFGTPGQTFKRPATITLTLDYSFEGGSWRPWDDYAPLDHVNNFGGSASGLISSKVFGSAELYPARVGFSFPLLGPASGGTGTRTVRLQANEPGYLEVYFSIPEHPGFAPDNLKAIDPTRPAAFGVWTEASVSLRTVRISHVPDAAGMLSLLGLTLTGLLGAKRYLAPSART
jgi:hypothetical protein